MIFVKTLKAFGVWYLDSNRHTYERYNGCCLHKNVHFTLSK